MTKARRVALAGLGHMGSRFAARLLDAGCSLTVWDRSGEAREAVAAKGASVAGDLAALAASADVVLLSLADDAAVLAVALDGGLLAAMPPGSVLVDLSTVSPETSRRLARAAAERQVGVLDAAVSGSTPQAEAGELVVLVGGDAAVLERCRPLLEPLSKDIVHMGPNGAGATMKLAVNTLLGVGMEALAEAIGFGEAAGLDRQRLLDGLSRTAVVAPALQGKLENARKDEYPVAFALRLMRKDFGLVLDHARRLGLDLPAVQAAAGVADSEALAADGDTDFSAVIRHHERRAAAAR